jgi:ubiquitin carboxyl-terminal hydrolase 36/42
MDLSLDISHQSTNTIVDALEEFTKTEVLDGDNRVYCSECKEKQEVTKGLRLATAPSILVCHLKRFAFDKYGNLSRLSKRVEFPQQLHIGDYMSKMNKSKPPPYDLVGVLVHEGSSCESGHYLAYVKAGGNWYKANDSVVQKVDLDVVLNQQAYLLLYEVSGMRHDVVITDKKVGKTSNKAAVKYSSPPVGAASQESTMTSSLMSILCGVSEMHDSMLHDICWQRDSSYASDSNDAGTAATECSSDEDNAKRAVPRRSNSVTNLQALESHASRSHRASTLSPVRRERYNDARSVSKSALGVRSPISPVTTKTHSKESPLPPRPKDYQRRHSSRIDN